MISCYSVEVEDQTSNAGIYEGLIIQGTCLAPAGCDLLPHEVGFKPDPLRRAPIPIITAVPR